ncbi:MAG TPA: hypothetical protein VG943_08565 [Caulobacterales bacterium]|nr:hypothetical protein [Caulobacterales bacterium]
MRLVLLLATLLAALGVFALGARAQEPVGRYCAANAPSTLLLIDRTTPYDDADRAAIRETMSGVVEHLGDSERLVVATIENHYSVSRDVFDACNPGCLDRSLFTNCSELRANAERPEFRRRLFLAVQPLTRNTSELPNSDITGTIARQTQRRGRAFTRVVIYSDMLENSQALPWPTFRDQPIAQLMAVVRQYNLIPNVRGATVTISGFGRLHDPGRPPLAAAIDFKVRAFWAQYFSAGGARATQFD